MDLLLPLLFPTLLPFSRLLNLLLTSLVGTLSLLPLLFPALLSFLRLLDLPLSLLFPTLLPFGAVLLLFLTALLPALLLLRLLLLPSRVTLLPALLATGLIFLPPLVAATSSALGACKVTCSQQRGGYRKRKANPFYMLHFLQFPFSTDKRREDGSTSSATVIPSSKCKEIRRICVS